MASTVSTKPATDVKKGVVQDSLTHLRFVLVSLSCLPLGELLKKYKHEAQASVFGSLLRSATKSSKSAFLPRLSVPFHQTRFRPVDGAFAMTIDLGECQQRVDINFLPAKHGG